jgi:hypothetical protein
MSEAPETNPYRPFLPPGPDTPFADRAEALARLRQHTRESASAGALVILGRAGVGKSALLRRCAAAADDSAVIVYTALAAPPTEAAFLSALARAAAAELTRRDFTLHHLPPLPPSDASPLLREWFTGEWLPEACLAIRAHRRLLWLVDDAQHLTAEGGPDADFPAWLLELLARFPQVRLALALDDASEPDLPRLAPLAQREGAIRLANLDADAVRDLLREPVAGLYTMTDAAADAVYRETGGQPDLAQLAGYYLFQRWSAQPERDTLTPDDVRALLPALVTGADPFFRDLWREASYSEKLVLTALSGLLYDDPLRPADARLIETWLVETDYPLEPTAIHAALRALEYREIITALPSLTLRAGLLRTWLLDKARLERGIVPASVATTPGQPRRGVIALVAVGVLVLTLLLALALGSAPPAPDSAAPVPTVTLSGP